MTGQLAGDGRTVRSPVAVAESAFGGLARWADEAPDAVALDTNDVTWTYRQLTGAVERLVGQLAQARIRRGTVVGVLVPPGPVAVALMFALLRCQVVFTWLDRAVPAERQLAVLHDCGATVLIVAAEEADGLVAGRARARGVDLTMLAGLELAGTAGGRPPASGLPPGTACVLYTSGTEGQPKGILQSERNIVRFARWFGETFGLRPGSRMLRWASFSYDAVFAEVIAAPLGGATVVIPEYRREDPAATVSALACHAVTHVQCVPSFARQMLALLRAQRQPLPKLRTMLLAGEVLSPQLAAAARQLLPHVELVNLYGPTETILASWHRVTDADALGRSVPVGKAIPGRHVTVVGPDGLPCLAGQEGEISIEGDQLSLGYLHTAPNGRLRPKGGTYVFLTGDRGVLHPDGTLEYRGRLDDQVKVHGNRVEIAEIEKALLAESRVLAAMVTAHGEDGDTVLLGHVVAPGLSAAELRRHLAERLPSFMVPREIRVVNHLPRLVSGKVDRSTARSTIPVRGSGPSPTLAAALGAAWSSALGCGPVGPDDDFFALGGDSLAAAKVIVRVAESMDAELSMEAFLEAPTFAEMVSYMAAQAGTDPPTGADQ